MTITGQGHPLVLFHGWGFDHRIWQPILPLLSSHFKVYSLDLPGFGQTPCMSWHAFKEEILQGLPLTFAVLGWSMGGLFATRLAIEEPKRVHFVFNTATSPRFIREKAWPGIKPLMFSQFYQQFIKAPHQFLHDFVTWQLKGSDNSLFNVEASPSIEGLREGLNILDEWDLRESLINLTQPVTYLFGELDAIVPRHTLQVMQTRYPHFIYKQMSKSAHAPFLSHPQLFLNHVKAFIL